jgi:CHAD domain-containing protein
MPADSFIKYIRTHLREAVKLLRDYEENGREEDLHQFRVSLKKIRCALDCMQKIEDNTKLKKVRYRVKRIFRQTGEVRDAQILLQWLKKNRMPLTIAYNKPHQRLTELEMQLRKDIPTQLKKLRRKQKVLLEVADNYAAEDIEACFFNLRKLFRQLLSAGVKVEQWHELRKLAKKIVYSYHWLPPEQFNFLRRSTEIQRLDELQAAIGLWHDEIVRKEWMGSQKNFLSGDEKLKKEFRRTWIRIRESETVHAKQVRHLLNMEQRKILRSVQG